MHPTLILLIGIATILAGIVVLRLNAFLALITAAIVVSLLAPGEPAVKIARVAEGFGRTAGAVGVVIALASIAGKAMMDSGAADRIVRAFLAWLGVERGATALCATGYVLSIPVFFDTVFYLLVPLARSMYGRTNRNYLKYLLAIAAGAGATHTLVPPTPGPLAIAGTLGVDLGTMVLVGIVVALPAAGAGLLFAGWVDRRMPVVPQRPAALAVGASVVTAPAPQQLPGLVPSILPIILPVLLISSHTVVVSMTARPGLHVAMWSALAPYTAVIGNPNLALLLGTGIALWVYARQRTASRADLAEMVETSLMSAGVMILIIAASGGFGVALQATEIGSVIERTFVGQAGGGRVRDGLRHGLSVPRVRGREPDKARPRLEHRRDDHDRGDAGSDAAGEWPSVSHCVCRHRDRQRVARRDMDERQRVLAVFEDGRRDGDRDPEVVDPRAGDRRRHGHGDDARARAARATAVAFRPCSSSEPSYWSSLRRPSSPPGATRLRRRRSRSGPPPGRSDSTARSTTRGGAAQPRSPSTGSGRPATTRPLPFGRSAGSRMTPITSTSAVAPSIPIPRRSGPTTSAATTSIASFSTTTSISSSIHSTISGARSSS